MGRTKKIGLAATFGARYGTSVKKRYLKIVSGMRRRHQCPNCRLKSVRRISVGVWECRKCGCKFAGGAYTPRTKLGITASRASSRATAQATKSAK